mmetsp:Transcript_101045/g.290826  ORF Transcript_101045/g.290826 Transcript_101045/m.290826 type:complete len:267 (-) Transcript_101045:8-808(-)
MLLIPLRSPDGEFRQQLGVPPAALANHGAAAVLLRRGQLDVHAVRLPLADCLDVVAQSQQHPLAALPRAAGLAPLAPRAAKAPVISGTGARLHHEGRPHHGEPVELRLVRGRRPRIDVIAPAFVHDPRDKQDLAARAQQAVAGPVLVSLDHQSLLLVGGLRKGGHEAGRQALLHRLGEGEPAPLPRLGWHIPDELRVNAVGIVHHPPLLGGRGHDSVLDRRTDLAVPRILRQAALGAVHHRSGGLGKTTVGIACARLGRSGPGLSR